MKITRILPWRKNRKPSQEHVSPDAIAKLLRETKPEIKTPEVRHFQFVVRLADDRKTHEVPAMIGSVLRTLDQHRASVSNVMSSLFVALLGVPFGEGNSVEARRGLVEALLREQ
jgi:hypothetical protein